MTKYAKCRICRAWVLVNKQDLLSFHAGGPGIGCDGSRKPIQWAVEVQSEGYEWANLEAKDK
jgi:hypothetical protein